MLKKIPNDLSPPFKKVVDESTMGGAYKIAWESRRFWEQDYNIYGGLSYLRQGPSPMWYPSSRLMHPTGVVVSGYTDELGSPFYKLTLAEKFEASRASIEKIHPGHGKELKNPVFCGWSRVPWNEGSWIRSYGGGQSGYDVDHPGGWADLFCGRYGEPHCGMAGGCGVECAPGCGDDLRTK